MWISRQRSRTGTSLRSWILAAASALLAACSSGDGPNDPQPLQLGSLIVTVTGLPNGAQAAVTVTGPNSFSRVVTVTDTLTGLSAGTYAVGVADVSHQGSTYAGSPATQSVTVAAGTSASAPAVVYVLATGSLSVTLGGLPSSTPAQVTITGPDGYNRAITEATTLNGLKPGAYSVEAREVQAANARYAASPGTQQVNIAASATPSQASVNYAIATGSLRIDVAGLPQGANAALTVTGPSNYSATFNGSSTIENLTPGTYVITAAPVTLGALFVPSQPPQQIVVPASAQAVLVNVFYVSAGTALTVQVNGLPGTVPANVTVTGPNGYSTVVTATQLLTGIPAGSYTLTASAISASCTSWTPTPATQNINVVGGLAHTASVTFTGGASGGVNLCIDGAYITQSVQTYDNAVPLVAGRNGLLRVFVRASAANSAQPSVRVRFYNGSTLVNTSIINATVASVPLTIDEATLTASWNVQVPGSLLQPGLSMLVDVDPTNAVPEGNENDNVLPASGTPGALDVRTVSPVQVKLVPVIQTARGDTGRVNTSNLASFINPMERMFPVTTIDADIREPYTYSGAELGSGGANWNQLLNEINAARVAEATGRSYYGVVRVGYTSGVAGLGYVGLPAAIGWDHQPSAYDVMAHEMGHNFGRFHAPCGGPQGVDNQFPYAGGTIGVYGYDIFSNQLKFPVLRDLMSYCDPHWISDYNYKAILNFRATNPGSMRVIAGSGPTGQRGLLVWGRIDGGRMVLEPGFEVDAPATLPVRGGPNRLEGLGPAGEVLFSFTFAGDRIADSPDANDQTFAFVVPLSQLRGIELARLRFSAPNGQVEQRSTGATAVPAALRTASGRVRVTWNTGASRAALIRNAQTGAILSIARGGSVDIHTSSDDLEVTLSDGVKSIRSRIRPR